MGDAVAVEEFGNILNSMLALKPPGVSGSKIKAVTELCVENVQSESVLIQKLYTHFKRAPGSHKLGVLYVVDSIVRAYIDEARKSGQDTSNSGPDGTFAAGVNRITDILTSLMNDIMQHAPDDTKEKIKKLLDIWARGSTFPSELLASVREKHFSAQQNLAQDKKNYGSTTPEGSPPAASQMLPHMQPSQSQQGQSQQQNPSNTAAILQALAQMAKQNSSTAPSTSSLPASSSQTSNSFPSITPVPSQTPSSHGATSASSMSSYGNQPTQPAHSGTQPNLQHLFPGLLGGSNFNAAQSAPVPPHVTAQTSGALQQPSGAQMPFPMIPQQGVGAGLDPAMLQQIALLQVLSQTMPAPQLAQAIEQFGLGKPNTQGGGLLNQPWQQQAPQPTQRGSYGQHSDDRYDGDNDRNRGPFSPGRDKYRRGRSRSRSPPYRHDDGPVRRRSPTYGDYEGNALSGPRDRDFGNKRGRGRGGSNAGGRGGYRRERSASPNRERHTWGESLPRQPGVKYIDWDESLKPDRIRVLSRTLFVGGVSGSEDELRQMFQSFGDVQSCIVNYEKRHAFIKMKTREDAVRAKDAMETHKQTHFTLRTRWGVGFGPRDCSDYQTGISDIPIDRLTEADKRWMLSAEFGGTGGRPMEAGMVIEEPDIEIGQGVSSKAISRRMQTDQAGAKGPKSTFHNRGGGGERDRERGDRDRDRDRDRERYGSTRGNRQYDTGIGNPARDFGADGSAGVSAFGLGFANASMGVPFYYQNQQHASGQ